MSKITLPNPIAIQLYYYFSTFTLFITWLLTPLLFYIILTQSKTLSNYKWFLLNHAIWSLLLESGIGVFKPVVLLPSPSGYIRFSENSHTTFIVLFIFAPVGIASVVSVIMTTLNRYYSIFPSVMTKLISTKMLVLLGMFIFLVLEVPAFTLLVIYQPAIVKDSLKNAIEFDPIFKELHEPSLIFIPLKFYHSYAFGAGVLFVAAFILAVIGSLYFTYLLRTHLTIASVAKLQRTLFISAIIQVGITFVFLFLPLAAIGACIFFEVPYSSYFDCLMFSIISCHTMIDYVVILSIITPYKKYIIMQIYKLCSGWKRKASVGIDGPSLIAAATYEYQSNEIGAIKNGIRITHDL